LLIVVPNIVVVLFSIFQNGVIETVEIPLNGEKEIIWGNLYFFYILYVPVYFLLGFRNLQKKYKTAHGIAKTQIRYVFLGYFVSANIAMVTNLVLPTFGYFALNWMGQAVTFFWTGLTTYAIVRHKLLDVKLVITRSLVYAFLLTSVSLTIVFVSITSSNLVNKYGVSGNFFIFVISVLIVFGLDPFKRFLSKATDRIFFKAKVDYRVVLQNLTESLSYEIDLAVLISKLQATLKDELKLRSVAALLRVGTTSGKTDRFEALSDLLRDHPALTVQNGSALVSYLRQHRHPAILESLERKIDDTPEEKRAPLLASKQELNQLGASLVSPVFARDHLIAVLVLGSKLSGDPFSNDDLQLIEVISPQIGSAIQKANLFQEVKAFSQGLEVKVEEATEELQERNVSLQTLQHITREITHTLDFNQVVQQIANSVAEELHYLGAILVFLDDDGRTVRARAITQTPLTKKALALLPVQFTDYSSDLQSVQSTSLGHQVLRSGEVMMTAHFAQVVSPPLPKLLAQSIQKLLGIKTVVVVPINSEGKTIGCIEIGVQKDQSEISARELETMHALADELGVVYRNIRLFDQIQKTNTQLAEANQHLQQLDQAKSEFVSIASHQLRTPMTGIMGYLSMMTSGDFGKLAPEHQKILTELLSESQRMIRLINQFLNVSKIEAGKFTYTKKETQLLDLVKQEIMELKHIAEDKGLRLETDFPNDPPSPTMADSDKIQDVMLNLIDNAIKYTAKGLITVRLRQEGDLLHFSVRDTGIGITPHDAKELFNKFVRGSGIAQIHPDGSGLGLFIAKSIIDSHGGKIWVESSGEGQGSIFQFTLPVVSSTSTIVTHS